MNEVTVNYLKHACLNRNINSTGTKRVLTKRLFDYIQSNQKNLMFIDLETIGFPKKNSYNKFYNPEEYNYYDNARIIEIGYLICDNKG